MKWHLALPLRETWIPTGNLNVDRARWKADLYSAARFAMHLTGELTGRGFDRELAQMLCRMYIGAPRDPMHLGVDREVLGRDGLGFDALACLGDPSKSSASSTLPKCAARTAEQFAPVGPGTSTTARRPWSRPSSSPGSTGHQLANGNAGDLPVESLRSGGESLDTSTILFPNGKFHCSRATPRARPRAAPGCARSSRCCPGGAGGASGGAATGAERTDISSSSTAPRRRDERRRHGGRRP